MSKKPKKKPKSTETIEQKRAKALRVIEEAQADQIFRWETLHNTIGYAGDAVTATRLKILEDKRSEDGYPLWMSVLITAAISFIPVEAIAAAGLSKLIGYSRQVLGRVKLDKTASTIISNIGAIDKDLGLTSATERALSDRTVRRLLENDKKTVQIVNLYKPEIGNAIQSNLNSAATVGTKALFDAPGKPPPRGRQLRTTDPGIVQIKRVLYEWIAATKLAESKAIIAIKEQLSEDKDIKLEEIERLIAGVEEKYEVNDYKGTDALTLLQHFVEQCIWCTTYNLTPESDSVSILARFGDASGDFVRARDYGDKFWDELTSRYEENPGETYKDAKVHYGFPADEKWAKMLEKFPQLGSAPALRLSYYFSHLQRQITRQNQDTADSLLKASKDH
jgi:hypothetical protein